MSLRVRGGGFVLIEFSRETRKEREGEGKGTYNAPPTVPKKDMSYENVEASERKEREREERRGLVRYSSQPQRRMQLRTRRGYTQEPDEPLDDTPIQILDKQGQSLPILPSLSSCISLKLSNHIRRAVEQQETVSELVTLAQSSLKLHRKLVSALQAVSIVFVTRSISLSYRPLTRTHEQADDLIQILLLQLSHALPSRLFPNPLFIPLWILLQLWTHRNLDYSNLVEPLPRRRTYNHDRLFVPERMVGGGGKLGVGYRRDCHVAFENCDRVGGTEGSRRGERVTRFDVWESRGMSLSV